MENRGKWTSAITTGELQTRLKEIGREIQVLEDQITENERRCGRIAGRLDTGDTESILEKVQQDRTKVEVLRLGIGEIQREMAIRGQPRGRYRHVTL